MDLNPFCSGLHAIDVVGLSYNWTFDSPISTLLVFGLRGRPGKKEKKNDVTFLRPNYNPKVKTPAVSIPSRLCNDRKSIQIIAMGMSFHRNSNGNWN